jgi:hypothetical protein
MRPRAPSMALIVGLKLTPTPACEPVLGSEKIPPKPIAHVPCHALRNANSPPGGIEVMTRRNVFPRCGRMFQNGQIGPRIKVKEVGL